MKRCTKCILPENFPNIKFNSKGVCNYCLTYVPIKYKGETALRILLDSYRDKGKKYDCIVPVSDGKDSLFVLYKVVTKYKLRVLALNYDSGFISKQARKNLENAIKMLHVDFISIKSKNDIQKKCLRDNIKVWALKPSSEIFPTLCYGCEAGYLYGSYKIASRMGIPLIILGDSQMETTIFRKVLLKYHRVYFLHLLIKFIKNPFYFNPKYIYRHLLVNAEFTFPARLYRFMTHYPHEIIHFLTMRNTMKIKYYAYWPIS